MTSKSKRRRQFGLREMLIATFGIGAACGIYSPFFARLMAGKPNESDGFLLGALIVAYGVFAITYSLGKR